MTATAMLKTIYNNLGMQYYIKIYAVLLCGSKDQISLQRPAGSSQAKTRMKNKLKIISTHT